MVALADRHRGDGGDDDQRDQTGDQRIFDGGRARIGVQLPDKRSRSMGISGKSAAGMGKSFMSRGRTHLSAA